MLPVLQRPFFFEFFFHFFKIKNEKTPFFPSENRVTRRQRRHSLDLPYTAGGIHSQNKTTDIQTVESVYSKTIHQEMEEDHETKTAHDEGVEKLSCQIEWRGSHVNLVYYNGKQVLRSYNMLHVTTVLHVRSEEHTHTAKYSFNILVCYL